MSIAVKLLMDFTGDVYKNILKQKNNVKVTFFLKHNVLETLNDMVVSGMFISALSNKLIDDVGWRFVGQG